MLRNRKAFHSPLRTTMRITSLTMRSNVAQSSLLRKQAMPALKRTKIAAISKTRTLARCQRPPALEFPFSATDCEPPSTCQLPSVATPLHTDYHNSLDHLALAG